MPRFINQDSYLGKIVTPPSLNRYLYAFGNPTVWVDPTGNFNEATDVDEYLPPSKSDDSNYYKYFTRPLYNSIAYGKNVGSYVLALPVTVHQKIIKPIVTGRDNIGFDEAAGDFDAIPFGVTFTAPMKLAKLNKLSRLNKLKKTKQYRKTQHDVTNSQKESNNNSQIKMTHEPGPITMSQRNEAILNATQKDSFGSGAGVSSRIYAKDIPTFKSGKFDAWFNKQSPENLSRLYKDLSIKKKISNELRGNPGHHEFLMVATAPKWKQWGVTAQQLRQQFSIPISTLNEGGLAKGWQHSKGKKGSRSKNSTAVHNELKGIINNSNSLKEFKQNILPWAEKWLKEGHKNLPSGFHN